MVKLSATLVLLIMSLWVHQASFALQSRYADDLCLQQGYTCQTITRGQTWEKLFPHHIDRDIVKRVNRMNIPLMQGMKIAVPESLTRLDIMDVSPFNIKIAPQKQKLVVVSLAKLAWAAYDKEGHLIKWGPASGGLNWCPDVDESCETVRGEFFIYRAEGEECISSKYPVETRLREAGGAAMPFCMFFHGGYALHGSFKVPGYNASHGCVRMFSQDARWLFYEFVEIPGFNQGKERTKVIVE